MIERLVSHPVIDLCFDRAGISLGKIEEMVLFCWLEEPMCEIIKTISPHRFFCYGTVANDGC